MEENGGCNAHGSTRIARYKRRNVSAIRDFPKGCGSKTSQVSLRNINDSSAAKGCEDKSNSDHGVVAHELPNCKNFELKRCPNGVAADSSVGYASVPTVFVIPSKLEKPAAASNILGKALCRKYPPRRRISAVRHFPLNFVKDVSQHTKNECIKAPSSSEGRSLNHKAENNDNRSMKHSSIETDEALMSENSVSCKHGRVLTVHLGDKSQDQRQSDNVQVSHDMIGSCCGNTDKNSIRTSEECRLPQNEYSYCIEMSESGNKNVASNVELPKLDGEEKSHNSEQTVENEVGMEIVVRNEVKSLVSESSHSNENEIDDVNVNASRAAPISMEIIDLEGECSRIEFSSKNADNNVTVCALMAAPNCPWRRIKVVNLSSPNDIRKSGGEVGFSSGKKKNEGNKCFDERRVLRSQSKKRKASSNDVGTTTIKARYPCVTAVKAKGDRMVSSEQDEGCDDVKAGHGTYDVDLVPMAPNDAGTQNDSEGCISCNEGKGVKRRYRTVVKNLMHKEEAISIRGSKSGRRRGDLVSRKILDDQGENIYTSEQNVEPVPVQVELASNVIKKTKRPNLRRGVCLQDISHGLEPIPIRAVNTIDDQQPPSFKYVTSMVYPDWCRPLPLKGCNCDDGCSDSPECACAVRNGGEINFNSEGRIFEKKPLVYECGPSCKCPPSCPNRVSQFGIKHKLEIFKTESRGWGVRSRNGIPIGSFICEYLGELIEDKQAEQKIDRDEYLYDIGQRHNDQEDIEVMDDVSFTIDAARYGNIGRFINHSCSPNLIAQDVLYDHENGKIPHVMLFAAEDIPPLEELTYDYNYQIGKVRDSNGNEKIKPCFCGSKECTGRLY